MIAALLCFIENVTPFFEKRRMVSEKRFGSYRDLPSNCSKANLASG